MEPQDTRKMAQILEAPVSISGPSRLTSKKSENCGRSSMQQNNCRLITDTKTREPMVKPIRVPSLTNGPKIYKDKENVKHRQIDDRVSERKIQFTTIAVDYTITKVITPKLLFLYLSYLSAEVFKWWKELNESDTSHDLQWKRNGMIYRLVLEV